MAQGLTQAIESTRHARAALLESAFNVQDGLEWCQLHTSLVDQLVRAIFAHACEEQQVSHLLAVVATGGYGRMELAPYSDIDLTVVPLSESERDIDSVVRNFFRLLHDGLGGQLRYEIGYAYRPVADALGLDARTRTGLLDARLVAGSPDAARALDESIRATLEVGEFLLEKLDERADQERRHGDTPLLVEPHLKEGAGGLRSAQCANWLRQAIGHVPRLPSWSYRSLLATRNALHAVSERRNDHLTRARIVAISERIGTTPDAYLRSVNEAMLVLHADFNAACSVLKEARYPLSLGVTSLRGEARVDPLADAGRAALGIAYATRLGLHVSDVVPPTLGMPSGPPAVAAISFGEPTLRALDVCGLLGLLLPELTACRTHPSDDAVHRFTVFEHTLRAIGMLDSLGPNSFLGEVKENLNELPLLYLALLLHDLGKVEKGRPHSESGAEIARDVCKRWMLSEQDSELVEWLVREHLTMAKFVEIRDVENPETVAEFAALVRETTRLDALTLLTWADVNAVAPGVWTPSQDTFLRELYERTNEVITGAEGGLPDRSAVARRLAKELDDVSATELSAFLENLPAQYLGNARPDTTRSHLRMYQRALGGKPVVEFVARPDVSKTEVSVCAVDSPGLLSRILAAFYAHDLSVQSIRAATTGSEPKMALDMFTVGFSNRPLGYATQRAIQTTLEQILDGRQTAEEVLLAHGKDPERRQRQFTWTYRAGSPGVLEIRAAKGRGLAYRFARWIYEQGWNISAARVGQWSGSGAAAFYLTSSSGGHLEEPEVSRAIEALRMATIS